MPATVGGALFSSKPNEAKRQAAADSDSEEDERIMNAAKAAKVAKAPEGDKSKKQRKPDERTSLGKAKAHAIRSKEEERAAERAMSSSDDDDGPAPPKSKPAVAAAVATITAAASAAAAKPKPPADRKPAAPRANGKAKAGAPAALSPETLALQAELTVLRDENERLAAEAAGLKNYKARARLVAAQTPGLGAAAWDKMMAESAPAKQQPLARNGAPVESSEDESEGAKAKSGAAAPKGGKGPKKTIAKKTKGPRQARNYYISAIWSKMKALPGTDADQLMRQGNLRWKALSAEEAEPYHAMARNDKKRTLREKGTAPVSDDEEVPEVDEPPFPEIEMPDASAASDEDAAPEAEADAEPKSMSIFAAAAAGLDYPGSAPPEDPDSE